MKYKFKKQMSFLLSFLMMISFFTGSALSLSATAAAMPVINTEKVNLYAMDNYYEDYISIPSNYPKSFQLKVSNTTSSVKWRVKSGDFVKVDGNGNLTPNSTTWYWVGNIGYSVPPENYDRVTVDYNFGVSIVTAEVDGYTFEVEVRVEDYAQYYAEKVMKDYADANITSDMTEYEKAVKICQFAAGYDYSVYASGYVGLIVTGGGDCWASTTAVNYLCDYVGIKAHTRYAAKDTGAGSGHRNTLAVLDGELYILDAGYSGTAPRYYNVNKLSSPFSYYSNGTVYQYDGYDTVVAIPEAINGTAITSIGKNLLYYNQSYGGVYVTDLMIPSSVTDIDSIAFAGSDQLLNVTVDGNNNNYSDIEGVLFSKDKKTLIYFPNGRSGEYSTPNSTQYIGEYAFYYSSDIEKINVNEGVTEIGFGAFGDCSALKSVTLPSTLTKIGSHAFYNCNSLTEITIPESVTDIASDTFSRSVTIKGVRGSAAEVFANEQGYTFIAIPGNNIALGDLDDNGKIELEDAVLFNKYLASTYTFTDSQKNAGDLDGNGNAELEDAVLLEKYLAGSIKNFPIQEI